MNNFIELAGNFASRLLDTQSLRLPAVTAVSYC
jgi:hypothetical protein